MLFLLFSFFSFSAIVDYVMHFKVSPQKANYERRVDVNLACFEPKNLDANEIVYIDDNILTLNLTFTNVQAIQILQPVSPSIVLKDKCKLYKRNKLIAYVYPKRKNNYYDFFFIGLNPNEKYNLICEFKLEGDINENTLKPAIINNYDWREYLSVFFPLGKYELSSKIKFELNNFLKVIPKDKICILYLIGYADSTPIKKPETLRKVKSNRELAYKRVKNVLNYLISNTNLDYKPLSDEELLKRLKKYEQEKKSSNQTKVLLEKSKSEDKHIDFRKESSLLIKASQSQNDLVNISEILQSLSNNLKNNTKE